MTEESFLSGVMSTFKDKLVKEADVLLEELVKKYKDKLGNIEKTNEKAMNETILDYHKRRKELEDKFNEKISAMVDEAASKMDSKIANIDDILFNDRNKLYQKIVNATKDLERKQDDFAKERTKWSANDRRCAQWLGLSYEKNAKHKPNVDEKYDEKELDECDIAQEEEEVMNNQQENISDEDFVTIKVDDRTFRTYRGTLTQVKDSFIAKLFGAHQHMMYRDNDGVYYLNCNPNTFGDILEILRKRGAVASDFQITPTLYAAMLEYGILDAFFPSLSINDVKGLHQQKKYDPFHVVFQSFRSTANTDTYLRWNVNLLSNVESKEDSGYWQVNENDNSEIKILKKGYYRIVFRCCINYNGSAYARIYVNGNAKEISYHYGNTSNYYKTYSFNEIREYNANDKLRLYCSTASNTETKVSYLCIERISEKIVDSIGIWRSSQTDSYYRQWNDAMKGSTAYALTNSNKNIQIQKGGLYRVTARMHTNHNSAGGKVMSMNENRNGSNHTFYNRQASAVAGRECHMFDEISTLKKNDYIQFYDNSYGTLSNVDYDCAQIQRIPFPHLVGHWRSNSIQNTYHRAWDYEQWANDMLYALNADKTRVVVKEEGNYRISAHITNTQPSGNGYSAMYINDQEYCICRMGTHNGNYHHTTSIQEIVSLKAEDKVHFYATHPRNTWTENSLFIEKLV